MENNSTDLKTLKRVTWRTAISGRLERFSSLIENEEVFEKYFGEKYIERIGEKIRSLNRNIALLAAAYTALMLSLFISQGTSNPEFEIFGYGFKNLGQFKEIILFFTTAISPVSAALSAYKKYLTAIQNECIKKITKTREVREFYSYMYIDNWSAALIKDVESPKSTTHGLTALLLIIFLLNIALLFTALLAASFILQIRVIYDIATNPSLSDGVNSFVIACSLSFISLSWVILILQLPLPETDLSNYIKLDELKQKNHDKYMEVASRISEESKRKERNWSAILSLIIFVTAYSAISATLYPKTLENINTYIATALAGAFLTILASNNVTSLIKKMSYCSGQVILATDL